MEAFFRGVAVGLGLFLGTLNPGADPGLRAAVHRTEHSLVVSATVERALIPKMEEALAEGIAIALTVEARLEGQAVRSVKVLSFQPLDHRWVVSGRVVQAFGDLAVAERAWASCDDLTLVLPVASPFQVTVRATVSFPERPEWGADLVWKSPSVVWQKSYEQLTAVPF